MMVVATTTPAATIQRALLLPLLLQHKGGLSMNSRVEHPQVQQMRLPFTNTPSTSPLTAPQQTVPCMW
jgi:hypothetical protein